MFGWTNKYNFVKASKRGWVLLNHPATSTSYVQALKYSTEVILLSLLINKSQGPYNHYITIFLCKNIKSNVLKTFKCFCKIEPCFPKIT